MLTVLLLGIVIDSRRIVAEGRHNHRAGRGDVGLHNSGTFGEVGAIATGTPAGKIGNVPDGAMIWRVVGRATGGQPVVICVVGTDRDDARGAGRISQDCTRYGLRVRGKQ